MSYFPKNNFGYPGSVRDHPGGNNWRASVSKIIVIGSGFGGLSAAARLAARGHQVELFEKRDKLGGRAYVYDIDGYKFDGGPTVITAPWIFDEIWQAAGRRRQDYFQLVPCDPFYRIFDHHRRPFDVSADHDAILRQIKERSPNDVEGYEKFIASSKEIFETGMALIDKPFLNLADMLSVVPDLIRLQSYRSVYGYVSKFFQDDFLRCCFSFQPLLIGGNPLSAASLYVLIHYLEREWGIHYAIGGTGAIIAAFERLLQELGRKNPPQFRGGPHPHRTTPRPGRPPQRRLHPEGRRRRLQRRRRLDLPQPDPRTPAAPQQRPAHQK